MMNPDEIANIARAQEEFWWYQGMLEITFAMLDPVMRGVSPRAVFEGGCGTGYFAGRFQERYGVPVVAADIIDEAVRLAGGYPGVAAIQADLRRIPLPSASFDLVILLDVAEHFAPGDDRAMFQECARLLRPGGALVMRTSAFHIMRSRHSAFVWTEQRFTRNKLFVLLAECGLMPRRATYANFLLSPLALAKFRVWEPLFERKPASGLSRLPGPVESTFRAALHSESRLIAHGASLPFGQTLFAVAARE
jgi:SAM-dependent methyltransferase